jgi:hypothetical protein
VGKPASPDPETVMKPPAPLLGVLLAVAGVGALALGASLRGDAAPARDAARAALVAPAGPRAVMPRGQPGRYWWSLAGFERAVGGGKESRRERLERLAAVGAELTRQAGRGSTSSRSRSLSLLGLTRLAEAYLGSGGNARAGASRGAASALRAAVVLDPANDDAKANLELVLQSRRSHRGTGPRNQGQGKKPGKQSSPGSPQPALGAGTGVKDPPVGY